MQILDINLYIFDLLTRGTSVRTFQLPELTADTLTAETSDGISRQIGGRGGPGATSVRTFPLPELTADTLTAGVF